MADSMAVLELEPDRLAHATYLHSDPVLWPPPHGLSLHMMALITTNCNVIRYLSTKWP